MSPENKQRIIGVVVLLAFIALLIPFLFTSGLKKKQSVSDEIPINAEKRQLIADQIQGMDNTTTAPQASPMPTEQPVASLPQTTLPQDQSEQPSTTLPEGNQMGATNNDINQPNQPPLVPSETAATGSQEAVDTTSVETVAPVKAVAKKAVNKNSKSKKMRKTKAPKEFWSVQVGSFSNQAHVQKIIAELYKKGFHVYVQKITTANGTLTRILVGRETSKAKALKIAKRIEVTMKIKGQLVRKK